MKQRCNEVYCIHVGYVGECVTCIHGPLTMLLEMLSTVRLRQWSGCLPLPACSSIVRSPLPGPPTSLRLSGPVEQEPGQS